MMSSLHNQPVVDDIVSAFETSQNQSWSIFNNKLGSTPIKDCKKKDIFKSENPIELSDEDIPVFGLVPRLEKLILVSCNKCSMIVKRDCIHHHYNRRHNNSENDNFSLQRFILPTVKINKHKKQKLNNLRKLPEKKIIIDGDIDPVVQTIKTEFDELEYERLKEINQAKIKVENEMQCDDENDVNLGIESCNPSTSYNVFDWNRQSCAQNLAKLSDQRINDKITDCNKDVDELSPNIKEEFQFNTYIKDENINYVINSNKLLSTLLNSNESSDPEVFIDFSGIVKPLKLENKNDGKSYDELKLINNEEQIKIITNKTYLDVKSDDCVQSDSIPRCYKLSTISLNHKKETQLESNMGSEWISDECSSTATSAIDQSSINPILVNEELMFIPNNTHSNDINYKNNANETISHSYKMYDRCQLQNNKEQTQLPSSNPEQLDETCNNNSNHFVNCYKSLINLSNINKEFQPLISQLNIKKEYQPLNQFLNYKKEYQSLIILSNNEKEFQPNIVKEKYQSPTLSSNIKKKYQPPIPLSSIKKEYQNPAAPLNTKVKYQLPALLPNIKEEYQLPTIPPNLKEKHKLSIVKEEYQPPTTSLNVRDEYYQPPIVLQSIKEKCNVTSTSICTDKLYNDKDDNSKTVLCQLASEQVNSEKPNMFSQNYNCLNVTNYKNSSDSITHHKSSAAPLNIKEEYQLMTELPCIKKETHISPNIVHSSIVSNKKENYESNNESRVLNNKTSTTLCLANDNEDVISNNISDNSVDSNSSNLILRIKKETQYLQNNEYTFNVINKTIGNSTISNDQSSITSLDVNKESKSLMTEHSWNSDDDYCSDDFSDTYFQGANGYHKNGLLYHFPSLTYLDSSNDDNEEMFKQIEKYKNESHKLLNVKNILQMKSNHLYNERTQSSDDDYTNDYYEKSRAQSQSNLEKLRGILLSKAKMKDYKYIENYKDDYHSSSDSSDNDIKSCTYLDIMSFKNPENSSVINYDELSNVSLYSNSNSSYSDSMCNENSNDSVSSNDQSISITNSMIENTKCTQTSNFILSQMKHKQCKNPVTMISELIANSFDVTDDKTKCTQTCLYFCKNCRRVVADLIDYFYLVNSNVKDCPNSYNAQNAVNNSILISANAQVTENPVDRFTPVSSSAQIVNNTIIPTSTKKQKSINNNSCNRYFPNLSNFQQLFHSLKNSNNHFTTCYNPIIKNNCQIENNEKICSLESHTDKSKQIENVLYQTSTNESTCIDKNHVLSKDRLKKNIDEKIVHDKNCNVMSSTQNNIEIKTKKSLKRRLEQVTDNKENQEKNNRWMFGDFKKLKRMQFVKRKFSCSDESDNNDNINE